jgi:hypothetical protein
MRALCGAIITAGALIGLGLTALGFGTRYGNTVGLPKDADDQIVIMHLRDIDRPLVFVLVFLTTVAVVGMGLAVLGLAYHHQRRCQEFQYQKAKASGSERITV